MSGFLAFVLHIPHNISGYLLPVYELITVHISCCSTVLARCHSYSPRMEDFSGEGHRFIPFLEHLLHSFLTFPLNLTYHIDSLL